MREGVFVVAALLVPVGCVSALEPPHSLTVRYVNPSPDEVRVVPDVRRDGANLFAGDVPVAGNASIRSEFALPAADAEVSAAFEVLSHRLEIAVRTDACAGRPSVDVIAFIHPEGTRLREVAERCTGTSVR